MLSKNLGLGWLNKFCQISKSISKQRTGSMRKNLDLEEQTQDRQKILASSRTGPKTARKLDSVLEPDPEPSNDFSQF